MKILFVDNSADLQQKWLDPIRAEGWGALRARSSEDAERMLNLHGDSIDVVVVSEALVAFAERHNYPYVVLTQAWDDMKVMGHQNSTRSAFHYQPYKGAADDLKSAIRSYSSGGPASGSKKEATQWATTKTIALEDFTNVLTKPEVTRTNSEFSIKLEAPSVLFGGEATNAGQAAASIPAPASAPAPLSIKLEPIAKPEAAPQAEPVSKPAPAPSSDFKLEIDSEPTRITTLPKEPPAEATRLSIPVPPSDATRVSIEPLSGPRSIEINFDNTPAPAPAAVQAAANEPPPLPGLPEVMEVKIDLGGGHDEIEPTRVATPTIAAEPTKAVEPTVAVQPADPTMVLESPLESTPEEEELLNQISLGTSEIPLAQAVGAAPVTRSIPMPPPVTPAMTQAMAPPPAPAAPAYAPAPVARVIEGDEALKNYLAMREQDVAVLTGQVRSSQERIAQLEMQLKVEKARSTELQHVVQKQEQQLKNYDQEKQVEVEVLYRQVEDLNQQLQERTNKAHTIEAKLRLTTDEVNKVKERVRVDIRRIRVREKELESQLEILKKDSAALLQARDEKILELKRKLDLLEFNMELIQEQYSKERQSSEDLRNRLKDAAKAMRQAGGLLEQ